MTSPWRCGRVLALAALAFTLVAGTGAWLAACSAPAPADSPAVTNSPATRAEPPLHQMLYTWTKPKERIAIAKQRLIARCMAARGFTYTPAPLAHEDETPHPTPFGLERAAPLVPSPARSLPPDRPRSQAFSQALYGDPDKRISAHGMRLRISRPATGCLAQADKRLLGDRQVRWLQVRIRLAEGEEESRTRLDRDPVFLAANARWRRCMAKTADIRAENPLQLLASLPRNTDIPTHPAVRADLHCKNATGYLNSAYDRLAAIQQQWLKENPGVTRDRTALLKRQDAIARDILRHR
ncbi:hypothetical protein ACF081_17485 [Streptomyces longwoodensis]|uniref:hypothetical protein n=1 Tax=Streptomyces longwoodensis TaxID=68231 RepID=UPI0036F54BEF